MGTPNMPHILSVEDDPKTRLLLKHQLGDSYEVTFASNVDKALEVLDLETFDLLLLDINLGKGKSGAEFLEMVRDWEDGREVPAVALTAYSMPGDREQYLSAGFNEYVSKPYFREELTRAIEKALTTQQRQKWGDQT